MSAEIAVAKLQGCSLEGPRRTVEWEEKAGSIDQKHVEVIQRTKRAVQDLQASEVTVKERLDFMEERLDHEMQKEHAVREADIREIRELVGCEKLSLQDYLGSVKDLLARENEARELHLNSLTDFLNQRAATCEARVQELQERLSAEAAARERQCSTVQASCEQALCRRQEAIDERLDRLERSVGGVATERFERLQVSFDRALQEHHTSVRDCIGGLERLLHDFVDEHSRAQSAAREDFAQLEQQVDLRFAEERACREAEIFEIRELMRSGSFVGEPPRMEVPPSPSSPMPVELQAQLSAEASARNSAALAAVSELLLAERRAVEARLEALRKSVLQDVDVKEARMRDASALALQDFLQKVEVRLQKELQLEQESRSSDVLELRRLIGDDKSSYTEVLGSVNDILVREQEARLQLAQEVQRQLAGAKAERESLQHCLGERCAALEEQLAGGRSPRSETSEKVSVDLLRRANKDFELRLTGHQEKVLQHIIAQKEQLLTHNLEVEAQLKGLQDRFEAQLHIVKDGIAAAWKDQLKAEMQSWQHQHENLKSMVSDELDSRERSLACLQALVQRCREDQLRLEKQLRERQQEAAREAATSRSLDLLHGEAEEQLQAERASLEQAARDLVAAERGARERSYASLHELLKCENEAMKEVVGQERDARLVGHSTLKDAIQREREVRERHMESHQEDLAHERSSREEANKALLDAIKDQRAAREEDKLDMQRIDSLERTACIFDGLVRAERAERSAEAKRLWDALDSHTHDLRKEKAQTPPVASAPPVVAPLPAASPSMMVPFRSKSQRPMSVSPRPTLAVRCVTPPCPVAAPCSVASSTSARIPASRGATQRVLSPQRPLLPVPSLPLFVGGGGASPGASPSTEVASPFWACGSASTLASEATTMASPCQRRSPSCAASSPQQSACHAETITCGSTRYVGEPHSTAEVLAPA